MESPTFDSFDVAAVKIEASEECSNNANTDFNNLCWLKKDNQDQVDDVLLATEQKYQFNDDLNNILDPSMIKVEEHVNLNNQNNLPCIKNELNGADDKVMNDHEFINDELQTENNHFAEEEKNNLVSFDDFGPETSVDEFVPEKKLNDSDEIENEESVVPMETTVSSSPSIEVTPNIFEELNFQEQAEQVIISPTSDLDDDSKQLSSVDNTNTLSEVDEEPEKMVFEHDVEDILKSPVKESEPEPTIDQNMLVEENNHEPVVEPIEPETVTDIDDNKNSFNDEQQQEEYHLESTINDSKANIVADSVEQQPPVHDSCEESDEEWNYMKAKEGHTEKENNVLREEFKENIEPEPVTEKEISSVELKEQVDVCGAAVDIAAPKTPTEPVPSIDCLQTTPEMTTEETNFHLNPDAKVFIPTAYTPPAPTETESHTEQNGDLDTLQVKQPYRHVFDDVVAQSPRKGRESNMDDFQLPAENDFDVEIANRPHELLDDDVKMPEAEAGEPVVIEEPAVELQNENELLIQNALDNVGMKDSLYVENTSSGFNNGEVDLLNTIQQLPIEEDNNVLSNKEGLSLEIDEKDVISPSSDDIKELVNEIDEKVQEMHIQESEVPFVENNSLPLEAESNVSDLLDESQPIVDISMEESKPVQGFNPFVEKVEEEIREPFVDVKEQVAEQTPEPVVEAKEPVVESVPEPMVVSEPVVEEHKEPVVDYAPEPVVEPVVEQISEPVVEEPVVEPVSEPIVEFVPQPVAETIVEKEPLAEEPKLETPTTNGDINVEELNKKNLEESAKLDAPVKIEDSKLLEATLGVVAVTAAATASVKAASAKKSPANRSTTLSAAKRPASTTTPAARKLGSSSTTSAAARPKTAQVKSTTERKPATTTSRTSTLTSAARPRVEVKKTTTTTTTLSKPKELTKTTEIRKTTTTSSSARSTVPRTASATAPRPRPTTASSLTNGISKTTTSKTTTTTSSTLKPTSTPASAASKPRLSPRSTVSSTLRKAETLKSPSTAKKEPTTSRIDSGLKSATKPATCPPKPSTLRASRPAVGTTSSTTSSRLTVKATTTTTTSQRKTTSPLDKKKTLAAPTTTLSARKSLSMTRTPSKSPGAKPTAVKPAAPVAVEPVAPVEPTVVEPTPVPSEVVGAPPALDIPTA